ncbi:23915_t:CDS:2, partial [Racocetra persica]
LAKNPKPWRINLLLELAYSGWCKIREKIIVKFGLNCKDIEYCTVFDLLDNLIPTVLEEDDTVEEVKRENPDAFLLALNAVNNW